MHHENGIKQVACKKISVEKDEVFYFVDNINLHCYIVNSWTIHQFNVHSKVIFDNIGR